MKPNATLIVGLVLIVLSAIAFWGGLSLMDAAISGAEVSIPSGGAGDASKDHDNEDSWQSCLCGLLLIGIGLGMGISGIITLTTGGTVQLVQMIGGGKKAANAAGTTVVGNAASTIVLCPHCNNDVAIGSGVKGTYDCPHCKRDFVWD
jgi:hypothetical protein